MKEEANFFPSIPGAIIRNVTEPISAHITSLIRHFEDLRDGTHGGSVSRKDKEVHFEKAVQLLAPIARQVLNEMNMNLLRETGQVTETGCRCPVTDTSGDRVGRSTQSRLPLGLSDRSGRDGKSAPPARLSQSNLIPR